MTDSTDELRALLAREQETDRPPPAVVEQGWARLEAAVAAGLPAEPQADLELDAGLDIPPAAAEGVAITSTKLSVALAAVVAGGVATWAATRGADEPPPAARAHEAAELRTHAEAVQAPEPDEPEPDEPVEPDGVGAPPQESADEPPTRPKTTSTARPRVAETPAGAADALAAELGLVEAARRALGDGNPKRSLELVRQHARLHPGGTLVEERRAIEALALCELGRPRARDAALQFQRTYPRSTHIDRVRAACLTPEALPVEDE
jgi:hypothetical protein